MKIEKIKPIPKYIVKLIKKRDLKRYPEPKGITRFYSYLTKNDGELVKVTVAVKNRYKNWHYKQVAVHGVHSDKCFVKDMVFHYIAGYKVGWHEEGLTREPKWYEDPEWGWHYDDKFDPYAPVVNPEYALKISAYKYSACDIYDGDNIIKYLRMYEKYPQLEYVTKMGLSKLAMSKQIMVKLGKDKKFRKWLSKNAKDIASKNVYISTKLIITYNFSDTIDTINLSPENTKEIERQSKSAFSLDIGSSICQYSSPNENSLNFFTIGKRFGLFCFLEEVKKY